ncbi:myo-inosose-2 dehydratase [Paenibacillus chungangensis]|uniref:Myo-inosose-2 dehydratase n=1 Tax=Paenibacillus chungangensis TaxID=696535 RepID=A0ABW3HL56_9BACL
MQIGKWKFGISPINWVNEDVHAIGDHYTCHQLLNDFTALGFTGTENCRKFPQDPAELKQVLTTKGLQLTSQWKGVIFADPSLRQEELDAYRRHAEFLHYMGAKHVVTCEIGGSPHADPRGLEQKEVQRLTDEQWKYMTEGLQQAGEICNELGMKLIYHYHASTVVEHEHEIDRLMDMTDPKLVHLLYDTGHAYYGGTDPLTLLRKHRNRIAYIHLKDVRDDVLQRVKRESIPFIDAVVQGVFTVPGDGVIDFKPIFQALKQQDYEGWMIIEAEQDPDKAEPNQYARQSIAYLHETIDSLI